MTEPRKLHELWMEQCEAAGAIKERYGLKAAFDYLVGREAAELYRSGVRASRLRARAAAFRVGGPADVLCRGDRGASCPNRTRTASV